MKKNIKRTIYTLLAVFMSAAFFMDNASQAQAASGFQAGNIMSDAVFTNHRSMSAPQINDFLNSKVHHCDTNGDKPSEYGGGTRRQYAASRGVSPPFTCLKNYSQNGKSAARIIYDAAQEFRINPQVLIVLIQKEQGLITDDWPWPVQYRSATGYGCPDTAPCDSEYYGLTNQVRWAARMFRAIMDDSSSWYTPYNLGNNQIAWHPDMGRCGHSTVNIQNRATKALYNYTPYRPNQAALNAGYGTGDSCSSYGNRNFYLYFRDWFGNPHSSGSYNQYSATWVTQSSYPTLKPGESRTVSITYRNSGSVNWYDNTSAKANNAKPVRLATSKPMNRASSFGSTWGGDKNRATGTFATVYRSNGTAYSTNPHVVKPGESARFEFTVTAASNRAAGTYTEHFIPIVEGVGSMNAPEVFLKIVVDKVYQATWKRQSGYPTIVPGRSTSSWIEYTNTGNTPWYDIKTAARHNAPTVQLASSTENSNTDNKSDFASGWFRGGTRAAREFAGVFDKSGKLYAKNPHIVKPGESVRFRFNFAVPENHAASQRQEWFQPVVHQTDWEMGGKAWLRVTVPSAASAKAPQPRHNAVINPLAEQEVVYRFRNSGNTTWTSGNTKLAVEWGSASALRTEGWESDTVLTSLNQSSVAPGAVGTFTVRFKAPSRNGSLEFRVKPAINGTQVPGDTVFTRFSVPAARYSAAYYKQSVYPTIQKGATATSYFMFKNTGNIPWHDTRTHRQAGVQPVVLATAQPNNRSGVFGATWGSDRNRPATRFAAVYKADGVTLSDNQQIVQPGEIAKFEFVFTVPANQASGSYRQWFQPIVEGSSQWNMRAQAFLDVRVP